MIAAPPISLAPGQRCHVSVLFADVCGYTALSEVCDPEDLAPILQAVRVLVDRIVSHYGGAVNEWRGDGVLCVFGLPHASERDARRAIQASLDLHEALPTLPIALPSALKHPLRFHSGIDSGLVFVREGDLQRGRYELIGDTVNTAARLCAAASEDEILAAESTLRGIEEFFETEPMPPLLLKGKRQPVRALRIRARSGIDSRFRASASRGLTPLVGRQHLLDGLIGRLAEVERCGLSVVNLVGPAGIGKTRLLEELQARVVAGAGYVLSGFCEDAESAVPLQPFLQMLQQVQQVQQGASACDAPAARLAQQLDALSTLLAPRTAGHRDDPDALARAIVEAFEALLLSLSERGLLVLLLDDWQWSDDSARQVLDGAIRALRQRPALIIVAARGPRDPLQPADQVFELSPFTDVESAQAVGALFPHALNLGIVAALHRRSGGNPLYLEELCRSFLGETPASEDDFASSMPATLGGLIRERVARLPMREATIIQAAAVLGNDFSLPLLERLLAELEPPVERADLVRSELVYESDALLGFRFRHGVTREVVYQSVRLNDRRSLHARAAELLEAQPGSDAPEPLEALAYHHAGAESHERAADYAERAGDKAWATSSLDRARKHYRSALEALDKLEVTRPRRERWVTVASKLATAWLYHPAQEVFHWIERMGGYAEFLGNARALARADYWLGWFHYAYGEQDVALTHHHRALERARSLKDTPLEAQLLANIGQSLAAASECAEAGVYFERARALKLTPRRRDPKGGANPNSFGMAYTLSTQGMMLGQRGDFRDAYRCAAESLELVEGTGHAVEAACQGALCLIQLLQGDFEGCLATSTKTRAAAARVGGHFIFAQNQVIAGYARWMLDGRREAVAELLHGAQWMEKRGLLLFGGFSYGHVSDVLVRLGDMAGAEQYAQRALERLAHRDRAGEALAYRTLHRISRVEPTTGDPNELLERARASARRWASRRELALTELCRAERDLVLGDATAAAAALDQAGSAFRDMGMTFYERQVQALQSRS